jgi:hypothetical protein
MFSSALRDTVRRNPAVYRNYSMYVTLNYGSLIWEVVFHYMNPLTMFIYMNYLD